MAARKPRKIDYSDPRVQSKLYRSRVWKKPFLNLLMEGYGPSEAARKVHVNQKNVYNERARDSKFAKQWEESRKFFGVFELEPTARRICTGGVRKKKFTPHGEAVIDPDTGKQYEEVEYPTTLIAFMLKGIFPEVYGDRSKVDLSSGGKPIKAFLDIDDGDPDQS